MRETKLKSSKGITLIALVITIIVLLILAGVAISMLSGDNGILKQAANAKTEHGVAQKEEDAQLKTMEMITDFKLINSNLKIAYGLITNINPGTLVSEIKLPTGYSIFNKEVTEEVAETENIATGMTLMKNNKEIGRFVIFGEVNCSGTIDSGDLADLNTVSLYWEEMVDYQKVAMDLNGDKVINKLDSDILGFYLGNKASIEQNKYPSNPNELLMKLISEVELKRIYKNSIPNSLYELGLNFEERKKYTFMTGVTAEMKIEDILNVLPKDITQIQDGNGNVLTSGEISTSEEAEYGIYINDPDYGGLVEFACFWIE